MQPSSSKTQEQTHSGHTPSPCIHESASRGLLALGALPGDSLGLHDAGASISRGAQSIPLHDLARRDNINYDPERSGILRRSVLNRIETRSHSTPSLRSMSQNESNRSLQLRSGGSEDLDYIHDSSTLMPEEVPPDRSMLAGNSIELLKVYRYKIAPWLDICESSQPFGVTLLTRLNESPSLHACVMQFTASASGMPWTEESSGITNSTLNVSEAAVLDVLGVASGMIPNFSWLNEDGKESRKHLLGSLISDLHSCDLKTSAYYLLLRLGNHLR